MTREKKLIRQIEYGDKGALGELIEMYYADILRYCRWHTSGQILAEDAAQETFLKMVRYLDTTSFKGEFRSFLYKIARNTCIDMSRKRYQEDKNLEDLEQEPWYLEDGFEQTEDNVWLQQFIHTMDTEAQEILLLRFGQNLTIRETAEAMGIPMRTVQSKLRSILKKLKTEFQQMDGKKKGGWNT